MRLLLPLLAVLTACGGGSAGPPQVRVVTNATGAQVEVDGVAVHIGTALYAGRPLAAGPWRPRDCAAWPGAPCRQRRGPEGLTEVRRVPGGIAIAWRLERAGSGPLEVPWSGIVWEPAGAGLRGEDGGGRVWWHGPVTAWDADGTRVPASLSPAATGVSIHLAAADARFPVTVDPIVQTAEWTWSGTHEGVHDAGDLDGDGHDELVVFSRGGTSSSVGDAIVVPGSPTGPDTAGARYLTAPGATWEFGRSAASAGDVNGDGLDDLIVGGAGSAWVWLGATTGVASTPDITLTAPTGATATGFGFAVSRAGDVDGDGYEEVLVSDPTVDGQTGSVWLFPGSAAGTRVTPGDRWDGSAPVDWFGISVAPAGDVDGDGYDDIVVGAANAAAITGYARVFHGGPDGVAPTAATTVRGAGSGATLGRSVDGAGDVDADGYDDVIIGIPGDRAAHGAVAVHHGSAAGLEATPRTLLQGRALGAKLGTSVSGAGDADGDGHPDIVAGSPATTASASVWSGGSGGVSTTASSRIEGGMTLGKWVDGGMDVDGDGHADVVISDPGARVAGWYPGGPDADGDGFPSREDCDDTDPDIGPAEWWWPDDDGDGWGDATAGRATCAPAPGDVPSGGDCDDDDAAVSPDAVDVPGDGLDTDCDGTEVCYLDLDDDGARTADVDLPDGDLACARPGHALASAPLDCDDADPTRSPMATEVCDGHDTDCDGRADRPVPDTAPVWFADADGDGYGSGPGVAACDAPSGYVAVAGDCDDTDPATHPGAAELGGDGRDQDCDGADTPTESGDTGAEPVDALPDRVKRPGPSGCSAAPGPEGLRVPVVLLCAVLSWGRRRRRVLHRRR